MAEFIQKTIKSKPVVIFSKTYCPFCTQVKAIFKRAGVPSDKITVVELDNRQDGVTIQDALAKLTGARTVPRVFIGGETIGGCDDTSDLESSGTLVQKLEAAGAL